MKTGTLIFSSISALFLVGCMNQLTRKISSDFEKIYDSGRDSFSLNNIRISYPASISRKKVTLTISSEYSEENYDSLVNKLIRFDQYLEKQLLYFNDLRYIYYNVNIYSSPKRGSAIVLKTHVELINAFSTRKYSIYPDRLHSEATYRLLKDSLGSAK